jgi:predicted O-linked N-acetylglucosamine transferase (SPINDLY family)
MSAPRSDPSTPEVIAQSRALRAAGKLQDAFTLLKKASAAQPRDVDLLLEVAAIYRLVGSLDKAKAQFERALDIEPKSVAAINNLAVIAGDVGEAAAAAQLFTQALSIQPDNAAIHSNMLSNAQYVPGVNATDLFALHQAWSARHAPAAAPMAAAMPDKKLKVGFLSADFAHHPVAYFMLPVFRHLDRARFELHCWREGSRSDALTAQFKTVADGWHEIGARGDSEAAAAIRAASMDILFDMAGHSLGNRLKVFVRRAAPVQVSWAGYVGTTGLRTMDYVLADAHHAPPGEEVFYTEKIARLPRCYVPYTPPDYAPEPGPPPFQANGHVTFGAFHNPAKLNNDVLMLWARIMAAVPHSRIMMRYRGLGADANTGRITAAFAAQGISADRLFIRDSAPHDKLLATYHQVDLALDPFPYSGGVTTCEALWMGVPVVTLTGRSFAGRHATSYLRSVGLDEFVTDSAESYLSTAVSWAGRMNDLATLRAGMRDRLLASPLFDYTGYARDFAAALRKMWADYCAGRSKSEPSNL